MKCSILLFCFLLFISSIIAQDQAIELPRLKAELNFDGQLNEDFWKEMPLFSTNQHTPINQAAPTESEKIYLTYDDDFLYLAAEIQGSDIQATSKKRDEFSLTQDWVGLLIDSYYDKENALGFYTTPSALRSDFTIFEDAVGNYPVNNDWNTYWDVKTEVHETYWTLEMRIPFSSLQFQEVDGIITMGIIIWRFIAAHNETCTWPLIANAWGDWSSFKPSQAAKVTLKDVKSKKPIYITPYVLGGLSRSVEDPGATISTNSQLNAGVDIKYSVSNNFTLDLSLNTDFAQVEADDAQINFNRFNLFFPEKRQFFQERSAIFDLRAGGPNRLFYSRRIGIDNDGNLEKIMGGVRLTGRVGDYDVGFINMTTRTDSWNPVNNLSVIRLRKKVLNANSYIGVIGTNKYGFDGYYNSVYGLDGTFRLRGNNILQLRYAQSFTKDYENNPLSINPSKIFINLEKFQFSGFTYDLAFTRNGSDYNPELGFEERGNFTALFAILGYGWQSKPESKYLQHNFRMYNFTFLNNENYKDETSNVGLEYVSAWKNGYRFYTFIYHRRERIFDAFDLLNNLTINEGLYKIWVNSIGFNTPEARKFNYNFQLSSGDIFNSKYISVDQGVNWIVASDFSLGLSYNYNPIFKDRWSDTDVIHVQLARLKFLYTISTKLSLNGFIQATSEGQLGLGNIRFRYNPREGVDLFLVYNNVTDMNQAFAQNDYRRGFPEQVFFAKLSYTFRL